MMLAQIDSSGNIFYVHSDQVNNPQKITNASRTLVWDREQEPFGETYATPTSTTPTNHRFPGQYADAEDLLIYNLMRDYDPTIGRYVQADPLGLAAGLNLYGYANQNPAMWVDAYGLYIGERFPTPGQAACDALNVTNPTSISQNMEYAGSVEYDPESGQYFSTPAIKGTPTTVPAPIVNPGITAGLWHTHGNYSVREGAAIIATGSPLLDDFNSDHFSPADIAILAQHGVLGWLGTPSGNFLQYDAGAVPPESSCGCQQ